MEDNFHPVSNYIVTSEYQGVRLDNCLIAMLKGLPRTKIYSIIRKGEVRVNSSRSAPSLKLKIGDLIFTGTPAGVSKVISQDILEGYIDSTKMFSLKIK